MLSRRSEYLGHLRTTSFRPNHLVIQSPRTLSGQHGVPLPLSSNSCPFCWLLGSVHKQPLPPSGETCLHQAAALGQRTICHYIVEAGASLMKTDQQVSLAEPKRPFSRNWGQG